MFLDPHLKLPLVSMLMWDWMHCLFINGTYTIELKALLEVLAKHDCGTLALSAYLWKFEWPNGYGTGKNLCTDGFVSGNASELLSSVPVVAKFLRDVVGAGKCPEHVKSFLLLCDLVDLLQIVNTGFVTPARLEAAILAHARAHIAAYGTQKWVPKHHYIMHLPKQLQHHGFLLNTFLQERKHKNVKRMCNPRVNTVSFDRGVLEDVTEQQLYAIQTSLVGSTLRDAHAASPRLEAVARQMLTVHRDAEVETAKFAMVRGRAVGTGDVVLFRRGDVEVDWLSSLVGMYVRIGK